MVGLSGVVGPAAGDADVETVPPTVDDEVTDAYRDDGVVVRSAFHEGTADDQPVETDDGTLVWVWGEVYSVTGPGGGRRSVDPTRTARVCADGYDEHGRGFVERLDGEFVGLLYDPRGATATFFVDRLGARPLHYATAGEGEGFAFSTNVQTVPELPGDARGFDDRYLAEYLYSRRTPGTNTPVTGVDRIAPATLLTYDPGSGGTAHDCYWVPEHRPVDRPLSYFVRELAERLARAVADRTPDPEGDREYGLLLSGGSDSRAVLAAGGSALDGYHMNDGWTREARVARRVADAVGAGFDLLKRGPGYHETLLQRAAPIVEFLGPFNTGHTLGFAERLSGPDALLTGLYSDALFGPWSVPRPTLGSLFGVDFSCPTPDLPSTVDEFVAGQAASQPTRDPPFLRAPPYRGVLAASVRERDPGGRVDYHGITYPSVEGLATSQFYYPITNGIGFDLYSSLQVAPTRNPFLDRRVVDLHLSLPLEYRLRYDVVGRALKALDPALAAVPHASTRLPIDYPRPAHVAGSLADSLYGRLARPASYRTEGPWQDKDELLRERGFVGDALDRTEARARRIDVVDADAVRETYRRHRAGEVDAGEELYRLLSVLTMPLTGRITGA